MKEKRFYEISQKEFYQALSEWASRELRKPVLVENWTFGEVGTGTFKLSLHVPETAREEAA